MSEKVLVVAFDGMDKDLIEKYSLENIVQQEFGSIDNSTNISSIKTSELFASFITGETYKKHSIKGLKPKKPLRDRFINYLFPKIILRWVRGTHRLKNALMTEESNKRSIYQKQDLTCDTLFEKIDASLPLFIPSYNPSIYWILGMPHHVIKNYNENRFIKEARHDTKIRLENGSATQPGFFKITKEFWDFVMLHLHDPDGFQDTGHGDLREEYERLDRISREILEEYKDEWTVIFMSDHGCPEKGVGPQEHNRNAFYSCNRELFGEKEPHITDFHDKILELVRD